MGHHLPLSGSTHTVEMAQITELNARLREVKPLTAAEIGLAGAWARGGRGAVPGSAVLRELRWDGDPVFPDIHALFGTGAQEGSLLVDLHTERLRDLSHRFGLHHTWGVGPDRGQR